MESQYDGALVYLDSRLDQLFEHFRRLGLYDDTLIVITSDHGEAFGDRALMDHAVSVYQDNIFVPLLIKYPRQRHPQVVDYPVSQVDVLPTVLDVLGYRTPDAVQGQSLKRDPTRLASRQLLSVSFQAPFPASLHPRFKRVEYAVVSGINKLITSTNGKRELYDLAQDPDEHNNLYRTDDEKVQELQSSLRNMLQAVPGHFRTPSRLAPGVLERLKSLGYAQ